MHCEAVAHYRCNLSNQTANKSGSTGAWGVNQKRIAGYECPFGGGAIGEGRSAHLDPENPRLQPMHITPWKPALQLREPGVVAGAQDSVRPQGRKTVLLGSACQ